MSTKYRQSTELSEKYLKMIESYKKLRADLDRFLETIFIGTGFIQTKL